MVLELIAALIIAALYIPLGYRLRSGELPSGWRHNLRDVLLTFVRDDIAKPAIGEHDADRFVPFLWTLFLFILVCNLLGMIPFCGSATGNIYVTGGLALCAFFAIHGSAAAKMGVGHYLTSMWPHFDVPYGLGYLLKPMIFLLEWMGVLVRNLVLAIRLFANMFAGHVVLATILIFIYVAGTAGASYGLWGTVTAASVVGQVALSLLELFVACLQAYIFTFLTALFMGMAMHPAH
jgi:F-type H+-transporting ATPase subunit a